MLLMYVLTRFWLTAAQRFVIIVLLESLTGRQGEGERHPPSLLYKDIDMYKHYKGIQ
jgi:hypothetical protein